MPFLYRVLRPNEVHRRGQGIRQKNPRATTDVVQHVNGTMETQYISTCKTLAAAKAFVKTARKYYKKQKKIKTGIRLPASFTIVRIDITNIEPENIIDLTIPETLDLHLPLQHGRDSPRGFNAARKNATKYKEVLITRGIPEDWVRFQERILFKK